MEQRTLAENVASMLLEVKAVRLNPDRPFKWASGWNSPIYCDNRITLSYPKVRTAIKNGLASAVQAYWGDVEIIAGVATAGIAQGALVADWLELPFCYVRPEPKKHGMGNQIEGHIKHGQKVVLVEDLVSTGGSSLKAVDALREAGANVLGMVSIFTYGFDISRQNFAEKDLKFYSLSDYDTLIGEAVKQRYISESQLITLHEWRNNPADWNV
jgi:orotate phosphoribosyltransferase